MDMDTSEHLQDNIGSVAIKGESVDSVETDVPKITKHPTISSGQKMPLSQRLMQLADYDIKEKTKTNRKNPTNWEKDSPMFTNWDKNPGVVLFSSQGIKDTSSQIMLDLDKQVIPGLDVREDESEKPAKASPADKLSSQTKQEPQAVTTSGSDEEKEEADDDDIAMTALRAQLILGMKQRQERKIQQLDVSEFI